MCSWRHKRQQASREASFPSMPRSIPPHLQLRDHLVLAVRLCSWSPPGLSSDATMPWATASRPDRATTFQTKSCGGALRLVCCRVTIRLEPRISSYPPPGAVAGAFRKLHQHQVTTQLRLSRYHTGFVWLFMPRNINSAMSECASPGIESWISPPLRGPSRGRSCNIGLPRSPGRAPAPAVRRRRTSRPLIPRPGAEMLAAASVPSLSPTLRISNCSLGEKLGVTRDVIGMARCIAGIIRHADLPWHFHQWPLGDQERGRRGKALSAVRGNHCGNQVLRSTPPDLSVLFTMHPDVAFCLLLRADRPPRRPAHVPRPQSNTLDRILWWYSPRDVAAAKSHLILRAITGNAECRGVIARVKGPFLVSHSIWCRLGRSGLKNASRTKAY